MRDARLVLYAAVLWLVAAGGLFWLGMPWIGGGLVFVAALYAAVCFALCRRTRYLQREARRSQKALQRLQAAVDGLPSSHIYLLPSVDELARGWERERA